MRAISKIHILAVLLTLVFVSKLRGQAEVYPELVPYQIIPLDPEPDCRLEVGIKLVHPYSIEHLVDTHQDEILDIIYKRIAYELVNPDKQAGMFQIDDKIYHLIRIPYTGAAEDYGIGWTWQ